MSVLLCWDMRKTTRSDRRRQVTLAIGAAVLLGSCGSTDDSATGPADAPAAEASRATEPDATRDVDPVVAQTAQIEPGPKEHVPSGLRTFREPIEDLPTPSIDLTRLRSGGPPPDGIPSIDDPVFYTAASVDYMEANSPVLALEIDGDARAYPLDIMLWHEIVNDTVGGIPVAVEYCPLCNSATVFDRRIEGRVLEFGVSGLLYNSSLVMYDRQTETLWSHFAGVPLYGALGDADLVDFPSTIVGFGDWREAHPDGLVLSRETGADRNYGVTPYPGYDDIDSDPFLFEGDVDGRFTAMTRVVGIESASGDAAAFPLLDLREAGIISATLDVDGDPRDVVAFWVPGSSSALDTASVAAGVDVGATGVFVPQASGRELTFTRADDVITDTQTGSTWNIFGTAIAGELENEQLEQIVHIDTFWFAWIAFHPDSTVAG